MTNQISFRFHRASANPVILACRDGIPVAACKIDRGLTVKRDFRSSGEWILTDNTTHRHIHLTDDNRLIIGTTRFGGR